MKVEGCEGGRNYYYTWKKASRDAKLLSNQQIKAKRESMTKEEL